MMHIDSCTWSTQKWNIEEKRRSSAGKYSGIFGHSSKNIEKNVLACATLRRKPNMCVRVYCMQKNKQKRCTNTHSHTPVYLVRVWTAKEWTSQKQMITLDIYFAFSSVFLIVCSRHIKEDYVYNALCLHWDVFIKNEFAWRHWPLSWLLYPYSAVSLDIPHIYSMHAYMMTSSRLKSKLIVFLTEVDICSWWQYDIILFLHHTEDRTGRILNHWLIN